MPMYMTQFSYSTESVKGLVHKPHNRREAAAKIFEAAGGSLKELYYCFGEYDGVAITEFPANTDLAAAALVVGASGAFSKIHTTALMEMDEAVKAMEKAHSITTAYTKPGG